MKDPERMGLNEAASENVDDIMTAAGNSSDKLELLLKFFSDIFDLAKPYSNLKTGEISCPNKRIPIEKLDSLMLKQLKQLDEPFLETVAHTQWLQIFSEAHKKIKKKLTKVQSGGFEERLK